MHFSLPLIIAAASWCTAAPLTSTGNTLPDKRADLIDVTPFYSGEWMNLDQVEKGVNQWCSGKPIFPHLPQQTNAKHNTASDQNGQVVPWGKSTNAQIAGLTLHNGGPGVLAGKCQFP